MKKPFFVFDLDGTLANTLSRTIEIMKSAIEELQIPLPNGKKFQDYFGLTEQQIFHSLYGPKDGEKIFNHYLKAFKKDLDFIEYFEGIPDFLEELTKAKLKAGVYTARGRHTTDLIGKNLKFENYFKFVLTGDDVTNTKPDPEGMYKIIKENNLDPKQIIYIGDTIKDINMAHAAGVISVAALWCPMVDRKEMLASKPTFAVDHPKDLKTTLKMYI